MAKKVTIKGDVQSFESMRVIIAKGSWYVIDGQTKPSIECPYCGSGILGDAAPHSISKNGDVNNSVVCQSEKCDFHQYIRLDGWNGGNIPRG